MNEKQKTWILRILIIVVMATTFGVCVYLYLHFGKSLVELLRNTDRFKAWIDGFGVWGVLVFTAIRALQTVAKFIPAEPMEIGAGLVWGAFGGLLLCLLGNMIGTIVILLMTRKLGLRILRLFHLENKLQSMRFLQDREKRNRLLFIFYLIPGTPKDSMTYFVGCTDANLVEFLILSSIARIPSIISSTVCGAFLGASNFKVAACVFVATALLSIPGAIVYKKISARYAKSLTPTDAAPEPESGDGQKGE
ncbi:MAG: TVP38/TMEM64 family protein [Clostridia bacterium]|nr:TVP38/TMEM64 family protein [Clostridia bacterium]